MSVWKCLTSKSSRATTGRESVHTSTVYVQYLNVSIHFEFPFFPFLLSAPSFRENSPTKLRIPCKSLVDFCFCLRPMISYFKCSSMCCGGCWDRGVRHTHTDNWNRKMWTHTEPVDCLETNRKLRWIYIIRTNIRKRCVNKPLVIHVIRRHYILSLTTLQPNTISDFKTVFCSVELSWLDLMAVTHRIHSVLLSKAFLAAPIANEFRLHNRRWPATLYIYIYICGPLWSG